MPPDKTAATVTTWHHLNPVHHPHLQYHLLTPSNVSAVTSSPIKAPHTSFMVISTLTGLSSNAHRMEQRDWSTASIIYGIPEELASDGGPEFQSNTLQGFLCTWGVHHQLSSVAFPHSNCRAELGVKIMKRILTNNTGPSGGLDVDLDAVQ